MRADLRNLISFPRSAFAAFEGCALDFGREAVSGAWMLRGRDATLAVCVELCAACPKCHYLSYKETDCSWYRSCELGQLLSHAEVPTAVAREYVTVQMRKDGVRGGRTEFNFE